LRRTYIIAEAGVNHNGSVDMAKSLIDAAVEAGADAVKFQTFKSSSLVTQTAPKAMYQKAHTDGAESQLQMLRKLELNEEAHAVLIEHCRLKGIDFLSTPFDFDSLKLLTGFFGLSKIKLPSGEVTNAPLLLKAAQTGASIILSTGMCTLGEVETALGVLAFGYTSDKDESGDAIPSLEAFQAAYVSKEGQAALQAKATLLHCTTEYPAPLQDVNLRVMDTLRDAFLLPVGYSDHTQGIVVPIAATARGANVIEKHFTLDRELPGPDHRSSLEPAELKQMVDAIRQVECAVGHAIKCPAPSELGNRAIARKSIVASRAIEEGEVFTEDNLTFKRPGDGNSPLQFWNLLGKQAPRSFYADEQVYL